MSYYGWTPYVSVVQKLALTQKKMKTLEKKGLKVQPIQPFNGAITKKFWGKLWCNHIENLQSISNRLDRGKRYLRNGSVCHLEIGEGKVFAWVAGSKPYTVTIEIDPLPKKTWRKLQNGIVGQIDTLLDLVQGKISDKVMAQLTDIENGLFPKLNEFHFRCSCPDAAGLKNWMCKHVAAVFYGIGHRFETDPELLFTLRGVKSQDLIQGGAENVLKSQIEESTESLNSQELEDMFGIEIASPETISSTSVTKKKATTQKTSVKKTVKKKAVKKAVSSKVFSRGVSKKKVAVKKSTSVPAKNIGKKAVKKAVQNSSKTNISKKNGKELS